MKVSGKGWMSLAIILVSACIIYPAYHWPFKAALFPMIVGIPLFILSSILFFKSVIIAKDDGKEETLDFKFSEMEDKSLEKKRTINITLWIFGFFMMVLFIGFPISVPLFMFLYLKFQGKEKWRITLLLTFITWVSFYGLFIKLCDIPFMDGWVQQLIL